MVVVIILVVMLTGALAQLNNTDLDDDDDWMDEEDEDEYDVIIITDEEGSEECESSEDGKSEEKGDQESENGKEGKLNKLTDKQIEQLLQLLESKDESKTVKLKGKEKISKKVKRVKNNCPLSVIFELDNCKTGNLPQIRKQFDKCEEIKLTSADHQEMDLLIVNIDSSNKQKRYKSAIYFLNRMVKTIEKGDRDTMCKVRAKIEYLKNKHPQEYIYMKYVAAGERNGIEMLYKKYEKEKTINKLKEWVADGSFERYSFKRIVIVTVGVIIVSIVIPLIISKQAMKYLQIMLFAVLLIGILLVAF
jgi:hypothetical protein